MAMMMQIVLNNTEFLGVIFLLVLWLFFTFLGVQKRNFIFVLFALITAIIFLIALTNWIGLVLIAFSVVEMFSVVSSGGFRL